MAFLDLISSTWNAIRGKSAPPVNYGAGWGGGPWFSDAFRFRRAPTNVDLIENYKAIAYACINLNVNGVVRTPLRLYATTKDGQARPKCGVKALGSSRYSREKKIRRLKGLYHDTKAMAHAENVEEVTDHPWLDAVMKVNPSLDHQQLLAATVMSLDITGSAFWWPNIGRFKVPEEIWALMPQLVYPVMSSGSMVPDAWMFGGIQYDASDLIFFRRISPKNFYGVGYGPLQAGIEYARLEDTFTSISEDMIANGPRPSLLVSLKDDKAALGPAERQRFENDINRRARGGRAGGVFVIDGAVTATPISYSPADLGSLQISEYDMVRLCNCFQVPVSMLKTDDVNRANAEAGLESHARDAIEPRCKAIASTLTRWMHSQDPNGARGWDRLFFAFDSASKDDQAAEDAHLKTYVDMGLPRNVAFTEAGFDAVEGGDEPLVANNLVTLASIVNPPKPEAAPGTDDTAQPGEPEEAIEGEGDGNEVEEEAEATEETDAKALMADVAAMIPILKARLADERK